MTAKTFKGNLETYIPGSKTLPQKYFTAPHIFGLEQEKIFRKFWMCVGHQSTLPREGEYFLRDLLGDSLIILRDKSERIRAFYNTCRHRGSQLCQKPSGNLGNSIQCEYHRWTYSLSGNLLGAPSMKGLPEFKPEENGLIEAPVHIWEGFIFVHLSKTTPTPFEVQFAPVLNKLAPWNVSRLTVVHKEVYKVEANWKLVFQNFSECLHCPGSHPLFNEFVSYTGAAHDLMEGPFLGGYMNIKGGDSVTMSGRLCSLPLGKQTDDTVKKGWYYTLTPNLLLNIHPDYIMYHMAFPVSHNKTLVMSEWLFHRDAIGRPEFRPQEAIKIWNITNNEDWHLCEISQKGIQSSAYRPGFYSPNESLLYAFDQEYIHLMNK